MADKRIKDFTNTATEADLTSSNYFALDGSAGTKKLPGNCIAPKSVQDNLCSSLAPVFSSSSTYAKDDIVTYQGKSYQFTASHSGAWTGSDVNFIDSSVFYAQKKEIYKNLNLMDTSLWSVGSFHSADGTVNNSVLDALHTRKLFLKKDGNFVITRGSGVSFNVRLYFYDGKGAFVAQTAASSLNVKIADYFANYPTAESVAILFTGITGATVSVANLASIVSINYTNCFENVFALNQMVEASFSSIHEENAGVVDLNEKFLWHFGALNPSTGTIVGGYSNRLYSDMFYLDYDALLAFTLKTGISGSVGFFAYRKDGSFIGWSSSIRYVSEMKSNYSGAYYFRIMLYNISGITVSVDALDSILSFDTSKFFGSRFTDENFVKYIVNGAVLGSVYPKKSIVKLNNATKLPCFAFIFDDVTDDSKVIAVFKKKGIPCGYAFIASHDNLEQKSPLYLALQNEGNEILNHSINGKEYNTTNYATIQAAFTAMQTAKLGLENKGFVVNGWVSPSSTMESSYKPIIGKLHAFGFVEIANTTTNKNTPDTPVTNLHRYSLQDANPLANIKDYVDAAITNEELVVFYGHASDIVDVGDFTVEKIEAVIDYVLDKRDAGLCHVGSPTDMVREYYELT